MSETTGLTIGKFYPPHNGHIHMIQKAAELTDKLVVIVLGHSFQKFNPEVRAEWIREAIGYRKDVTVVGMWNNAYDDYDDDNVWLDHDHIMKAAMRRAGITKLDYVFSSEDYGNRMAEMMNAVHVPIDIARNAFPLSATMVRGGLYSHWSDIPNSVRKTLGTRIVVVGSESSGTTTLATDLAAHYAKTFPSIEWVPEYGREYTYSKLAQAKELDPTATMESLVWTAEDFKDIGMKQNLLEEEAASKPDAAPLLICDTDALTTSIWQHRYLNDNSIGKPEYANTNPPRDLYIITNHERVDFDQDGIRDGEEYRPEMTRWFEDELTRRAEPWVILTGDREERLYQAVKIVDNILAQKAYFAPWIIE